MSRSAAEPNFTDLLSVPYVSDGHDPGSGLDCFGLMEEVYRRLGIALDLPEFEHGDGWQERVAPFVAAVTATDWEEVGRPQHPGDVILFRNADGPLHVAVMIDRFRAIHTNGRTGVSIFRARRFSQEDRIVEGVYRRVDG